MADRDFPPEIQQKLAELDLELSEGEYSLVIYIFCGTKTFDSTLKEHWKLNHNHIKIILSITGDSDPHVWHVYVLFHEISYHAAFDMSNRWYNSKRIWKEESKTACYY